MSNVQDDTVTLLLSNAINRDEPDHVRAQRIRKCAKALCKKTTDKPLKAACRKIRDTKNDLLVIQAVSQAEFRYWCGA